MGFILCIEYKYNHSPAGHFLQAPAPGTVLYLPAGHVSHGPPSGPVKPALQVQAEAAALLAGELDPAQDSRAFRKPYQIGIEKHMRMYVYSYVTVCA